MVVAGEGLSEVVVVVVARGENNDLRLMEKVDDGETLWLSWRKMRRSFFFLFFVSVFRMCFW